MRSPTGQRSVLLSISPTLLSPPTFSFRKNYTSYIRCVSPLHRLLLPQASAPQAQQPSECTCIHSSWASSRMQRSPKSQQASWSSGRLCSSKMSPGTKSPFRPLPPQRTGARPRVERAGNNLPLEVATVGITAGALTPVTAFPTVCLAAAAEEEAEEAAADASCFTAQSRPLRAARAPVEADSCAEVVAARAPLPVVASCAAVFAECC